jgi:hypothetical protein
MYIYILMSFFNGITDLNTGTLNVGGTSNMSGTVNIAGNLNTIGLDNCNDLLVNNSATIGALPSSTVGFYGATGISRQSLASSATTGQIVDALAALGLVKKV